MRNMKSLHTLRHALAMQLRHITVELDPSEYCVLVTIHDQDTQMGSGPLPGTMKLSVSYLSFSCILHAEHHQT